MQPCRCACLVRCGFTLALIWGTFGACTQASASPAYGYTLISAGYSRGCAACHDDNAPAGGANTANKAFAKTMKRLGLTGGNKHDVFLDILDYKLQDYDTDCDGVIDLDELTNDGDPNDPAIVPEGSTAMFVVNCNGDVDTGSTSDTSGATSSSSEEFDDSPSDSGCALAPRASDSGVPIFVTGLLLLGLVGVRRRAVTIS